MPMEALSANVNKTAAAGTDCCGQMLLVGARKLVASGKYRFAGMGDGLAATTTTPGVDIFTANGGLGYKTSGSWSTAVANSFSNALAWYRLQELDNLGLPTGREIGAQRGSGTALGNDRFNVFAFSKAGWSGASSATSFFATGTYASLYSVTTTTFGSAGVNIVSSVSSSSPYLGGTGVLHYCIWTPDGRSAANVQPFMFVWDGTGPDPGGAFIYEALRCTAADTTPYVIGGGTCSQMFGESSGGVPDSFLTSSQPLNAYDESGVLTSASILRVNTPDGLTHPGSATPVQVEVGGTYPVIPAFLWLDTATSSQYKGEFESLKHQFPLSSSYMGRATFNADADSGDLAKPPLRSLGHLVAPWLLGVSLVETKGNFNTVRTAIEPEADPDTTPPTVTRVAPEGKLSKRSPVVLDIVEDVALRGYFLVVRFPGTSLPIEPVYISPLPDAPTPYTVTSQTPVAGTIRLTIYRKAGWTHAPTFEVFPIDTSGNMSV